MQVLFSAGGFVNKLSLEEQVIIANEAGFDGIDYIASLRDLFFSPNRIINLAKKHRVKVKTIHIPLYLVIYTPMFLFNCIIKFVSYFPENEKLNFHLSGFLNPLSKNLSKLEIFKKIMQENKINITCESNPNEYVIFKYYPKETYDPVLFAEFCIQNRLSITLDISHIAAWDCDIVKFFKKYHSYINMIHLSDMNSTHQHLSFGKGELPLKELFREIKNVFYEGIIVFEISNFNKDLTKENVLKELKDSLQMFKKHAL